MTTLRLITATAAAALLMGCSAAKDTASDTAMTPGADISAAPSGTYKSEQGHAYVAFSYSHQGYSNPILRWAETNATIELDSENPENSTLTVSIPAASIDSGVAAFDEHLVGPDFFDVTNHPTITFTSTDINQAITGGGSVTGDLTIKGVTKPFTLTGKVNKVGKHFRSKADMFGVSVTGKLKRSDFGVDKYGPMADDIEIMVEVEFQKEG
ncbi:MAG: YceI family protein [Maricaulaceae bacterium]